MIIDRFVRLIIFRLFFGLSRELSNDNCLLNLDDIWSIFDVIFGQYI